jgi:hypothetical protein
MADSQNISQSMQSFFYLSTDSVFPVWKKCFVHPDSMIPVLHFAERLKNHCPADAQTKFMFTAMGNFWIERISKQMDSLIQADSYIKNAYSSRYIIDRCAQNEYLINLKVSKFEKGLIRLSESKFGYILNRIFLDFNLPILILSGIFGLFTLVSWFVLMKVILNKVRKKIQQ